MEIDQLSKIEVQTNKGPLCLGLDVRSGYQGGVLRFEFIDTRARKSGDREVGYTSYTADKLRFAGVKVEKTHRGIGLGRVLMQISEDLWRTVGKVIPPETCIIRKPEVSLLLSEIGYRPARTGVQIQIVDRSEDPVKIRTNGEQLDHHRGYNCVGKQFLRDPHLPITVIECPFVLREKEKYAAASLESKKRILGFTASGEKLDNLRSYWNVPLVGPQTADPSKKTGNEF